MKNNKEMLTFLMQLKIPWKETDWLFSPLFPSLSSCKPYRIKAHYLVTLSIQVTVSSGYLYESA